MILPWYRRRWRLSERTRDKCWTDVAGGGLGGTRTGGSTCLGQGVPRDASSSTSRARVVGVFIACLRCHRRGRWSTPPCGSREWSRQYALSRSRRLLRQLVVDNGICWDGPLCLLLVQEPQTGLHLHLSREKREVLVIQGTDSAGRIRNFLCLGYCVLVHTVQAQDMTSSPRGSASACYRSGAQMERSLTDRQAGRILISQFAAPPLAAL